jgi:hypothetical protein
MKRHILFILFALIVAPLTLMAQNDGSQSDPFEDDPFFTKPIDQWFSVDNVVERVSQRADRMKRGGGVDNGFRDLSGFSENPGFAHLDRMGSAVRFNRVEALYLGVHIDRSINLGGTRNSGFDYFGSIGYSFGRKDWLYTIGVERAFGMKQNVLLGVNYSRVTDSEDNWRVGSVENSLFSFFSVFDYKDYFDRQGAQVYGVIRPTKAVELSLSYSDENYKSLPKETGFSVFGKGSSVRDNPMIESGKLQLVRVGAQLNPNDLLQSDYWGGSLDLDAEFSDLTGNSDYDYQRFQLETRNVFLLDPGAALQNRIKLVSVTGSAPNFKYLPLGGISTMRATPFKSMMGSSSVLINTELHFGFFRSVGYEYDDILDIDLSMTSFSIFADLGWTNGSFDSNNSAFEGFDGFSFGDMAADVGVGVNFSSMRVEAAWKANDLARTPVIWIRLNPTF